MDPKQIVLMILNNKLYNSGLIDLNTKNAIEKEIGNSSNVPKLIAMEEQLR